MSSYNTLTINLAAIEQNIGSLGPIIPMVKGNAHGTDPIILSSFLQTQENVRFLGVAHLQEAIHLRNAGIEIPILLLSFLPHEAALIAKYNITPVVDTIEKVMALENAGVEAVHLHLDTGMHRFGVSLQEAPLLLHRIRNSNLELEGVMTHFASSELHPEFTREQTELFERFVTTLQPKPRWIHAASSFALKRFSLPFCNLSRIGLSLFTPTPVLELTSTLIGIKSLSKGDSVGYNRQFIAKDDMRIAIVPIGYHDGWHLSYSEKAYVLIHGKKAPMIGRICMDFMMVDITHIPEAKIADSLLLFGKELPFEQLAQTFDTNPRQLICSLGPRIERKFTHAKLHSAI